MLRCSKEREVPASILFPSIFIERILFSVKASRYKFVILFSPDEKTGTVPLKFRFSVCELNVPAICVFGLSVISGANNLHNSSVFFILISKLISLTIVSFAAT